jgi:hypothetical protein
MLCRKIDGRVATAPNIGPGPNLVAPRL